MSPRRGYLLAEALCALALSALLAVAAGMAMRAARAATTAAELHGRAERTAREALLIVGALARDADSLVVLGDTSLELSVRIASGVVCATDSTSLTLAPWRVRNGAPLTARAQPIEAGDVVGVLVGDSLMRTPAWVPLTVDSADERRSVGSCGTDEAFVAAEDDQEPRPHLMVRAVPAAVRRGTPVRVFRRGRLTLYSAGRGDWMLGWRRCIVAVCGVVQPVAGSLRTPGSGGFVSVIDPASGELRVSVRVPGIDQPFRTIVGRSDAGW